MVRTSSLVEVTDLRAGSLLFEKDAGLALADDARDLAVRIVEVAERASLGKAASHAHRLVAAVGALLAERALSTTPLPRTGTSLSP